MRHAEVFLVERVIHGVGLSLETELRSEHLHFVLQSRVVAHECLVPIQLNALAFTVFFLALGDFQSERVHLLLQLRLECQVLLDFVFEAFLELLDFFLLSAQFGVHRVSLLAFFLREISNFLLHVLKALKHLVKLRLQVAVLEVETADLGFERHFLFGILVQVPVFFLVRRPQLHLKQVYLVLQRLVFGVYRS